MLWSRRARDTKNISKIIECNDGAFLVKMAMDSDNTYVLAYAYNDTIYNTGDVVILWDKDRWKVGRIVNMSDVLLVCAPLAAPSQHSFIVGKIDNFDIKLDKIKHSCLQMAEKDVDMAIKDCQNYCAPLGALDSIEEQWKRYKVLANDDYR